MPRPGPRRIPISVRVDPGHALWLVKEAERRGTSQGGVIRALIDAERHPQPNPGVTP